MQAEKQVYSDSLVLIRYPKVCLSCCDMKFWYGTTLFNECRFLDQCTLVKFVSATTSNVVWTPGDVSAVVREKSHSQFAMHMCLGSAGILN